MKLAFYLIPCTKINSIWIKDLNVRLKLLNSLKKTEEKSFRALGVAMTSWIGHQNHRHQKQK